MSILIMNEVWQHAPADKGDLLILLALADWADDTGRCFPAVATLAAKGRMSERNAQRCVQSLQDRGIIRVVVGAGPKGCNVYHIDIAAMRKEAARETHTGDKMSPPDAGAGGDVGVTGGVTFSTGGGDVGVTQTVIEPSIEPSERERVREATEGKGNSDHAAVQRSERPGTAEFEKRVQRFITGDGYIAGEWPKGLKDTSLTYIRGHFGKLSVEDRRLAEANRDAFLSKCRRDAIPDSKIMGVGNYFKDRAWELLTERDRNHATEIAQRKAGKPNVGKPDNFVTAYGPVHSAAWVRLLLVGPDRPDLAPANGIWLRNTIRMAWPSLERFILISDQQKGVIASDLDFSASRKMVFVPFDTDCFAEWRHAFRERGWPDLPSPNGMTGLYLPAGGPSSLDNFQNSGVTNDAA